MTQNLVISGYGWLAGYVGNALSGKVNIMKSREMLHIENTRN